MMKRLKLLTLALLLLVAGHAMARQKSIVPLADPYILLDGDTYYAYGTGSPDGIAVWTSTDLCSWQQQATLALHRSNTTEQQWFWAPEVYRKNGTYYMYYSANEHLYVATAQSPRGPFKQVGGRMMERLIGDEKCIDSSVFFDDDGQAYCFFVRFTDGNCIWMCELDDDLVTPREGTLTKCISVSQPWEDLLGRVCEGPFIVKKNGIYYLTYSANDYRSQDYAVGYAMTRSLKSKGGKAPSWTKYDGNPIVHRTEGLVGTGHHSLFTDRDGQLRIVFHAHDSETAVAPRRMYIGTMAFKGNRLSMTGDALIRPAATGQTPPVGGLAITDTPSEGSFALVSDAQTATIVVADEDADVVRTAAECLAGDVELVSGRRPAIANSPEGIALPVIAGTVGTSPLIDQLAAAGRIDVSAVRGKWEVYTLQLTDSPRALVVAGSTPRGTAYGLLELSRLMGVSPWVWWADVVPQHRDALYVGGTAVVSREPSVRYRGIFINDEDFGLQPWAAKGIDKQYNNIGPGTYARVMELLLRLRANTLWPAMHLCSEAFWANKANLPVARKYDIVLGSSHCEQMLRDNEWEWRHEPWNGTNEDWNYVENTAKIQRYWEERVAESVGYDAMYTMGMRGVHDWGISGYPSTADKVRGLTEIIGYQRSLLDKHLGDARQVPQLFIPYKEVLDAYNAGLEVPDDITLCWVDDNHGYIRQLPRQAEQARSGGNGVYYHVSYWGSPADYLWICSHSPSLMSYELSRAYDQGVRTLWVVNVGDIKPAEMELEFCMDLAWDIDSWQPATAIGYSRDWAARTFGEDYADDIAAIKREYYRLAAGGKPEHLHIIDYTDADKNRRISDYAAIAAQVDDLKARLPQHLLDAYYELIEYPVKSAYNMNVKTFRAAQSLDLARHGHADEALAAAAEARQAYRQIGMLTSRYNTGIAGGKWNGIMSFRPRNLPQFDLPPVATAETISDLPTPLAAEPAQTIVAATACTSASPGVAVLPGVGLGEGSVTVWPLDMRAYAASEAQQAPYVEYSVPVRAGAGQLQVRCLPTFPINTDYDLRIAVSIDGAEPVVRSIKTVAMQGWWHTTVAQGYADVVVPYVSPEDRELSLRVSLLDPGVVVSEVRATADAADDLTLTRELIENYDFEYDHDGVLNPVGTTSRGIPQGWLSEGELRAGSNGLPSYGVNQDATRLHGDNVCWINSQPMPADFRLYQTIPALKLTEGLYRVRCRLWVETNKKTTCRLFANQSVEYYGYESDYTNLLTPGERNSYAGYAGGSADSFELREMEVYVSVASGEDLTIGIKTSNRRNDGTVATDNAGWFKVDYFRIDRVEPTAIVPVAPTGPLPAATPTHYYDLGGRRVAPRSVSKGLGIAVRQGGASVSPVVQRRAAAAKR